MPFTLTWSDIAVRLVCTLIAGILVGIDRDEKGRAAGMRTNVLVCLAASLSMILANGMLGTGERMQVHSLSSISCDCRWAFSPAWDSSGRERLCARAIWCSA
jgi:uncharacterized membrane protein YhiD involved in acid resistance